jgi:hypothetical protein
MSLNHRVTNLEKAVHRLEDLIGTGKHHNKAVEQQGHSDQKSEDAPWPTAIIPPTPKNTGDSKRGSDTPIPWWKRTLRRISGKALRWNWWRVPEGLGIIAVIWYAAITHLQWQDLRHNFEADQRAWVGFIELEEPNEPAVGNFRAGISAENRGKTPAVHAKIRIGISEPYCLALLPSDPFQLVHTMPKTVETSLLPNHPQKSGIVGISISADDFRDLRDLEKKPGCRLLVFASVDYCDVFGHAHFRHFCSYWQRSGKEFDICESYNDGDEDYPNKPASCPAKPDLDVVTITTK